VTNKTKLRDSDMSWPRTCIGVHLGPSFVNYKEAMTFSTQPDIDENRTTNPKTVEQIKAMLDAVPLHFTKPNHSDSSVGGNDAINPYWSFNKDDDIVHPITSRDGRGDVGMGRVYSEAIDRNQQILWMSMGVPEFSGLADFFADAADAGTAKLMSTGEVSATWAVKLGALIGKAGRLAFELPFLPLIWANKLVNRVTKPEVTKYYDFKATPTLYYRMVNVILSQLAVSMGLYANGMNETGGANEGDYASMYESGGMPEIMKNGPDIFAIMDKRAARMMGKPTLTEAEIIAKLQDADKKHGWFDSMSNVAMGGAAYVGFRIEKSVDASESISNTTGESSIASSLNSKTSMAAEARFGTQGGTTGIATIDAGIKSMTDVIKGVAGALGVGGAVEVLSGNGRFDIPEVYKSSSFVTNQNFSLSLHSPYGDPVSIYQAIYIPLAMLLAAAMPRGIGTNMYTSPFLIRAYCKGMFAVPLGIIESMTIKRGLPEFGWAHNQLPTSVNVTLNIKNLSPAMFLSIADQGLLDAFKHNNSMQEYMSTLSGIGLAERTFQMPNIKRKLKAALLIKKNTVGSPLYWANTFGNSALPRSIAAVMPFSRVSNR